jgi:hypothetical protein
MLIERRPQAKPFQSPDAIWAELKACAFFVEIRPPFQEPAAET